ncbi:putative MFS aflatoxin efflux pump [Biscogniauxia sp. FL1348]|nr:putative MFS aflatoxin efflux pump [Biscogniauxia sp. FL1348]
MAGSVVASNESYVGLRHDPKPPYDTPPQTNTIKNTGNPSQIEDRVYPSGLKLVLILLSVFMSLFLVSLDRLIVSTAIPKTTDEFHSLQDAGSVICGAAPSSVVLIVGRDIQGVGAAGIFSGVIVVLVFAVPLHQRPLYQGLFGAVFGISSVIGPLVGGAFTSSRAISLVIIGFLLDVPDSESTRLPSRTKLPQLDAAGATVLIPGVICLLSFQWGGLTYSWNNGRIIALLTLGIALLLSFILVQASMPATATIPPRIIKQRSVAAGFGHTICISFKWSSLVINMCHLVYYLPIWFQAIRGVSTVDSGLYLLPLTLAMVIASISNGILVSKVGYYTPSSILGTCIMSIGAGLFKTLELDTSRGKWIGYQSAQTVLPIGDVPIGSSLMFFTQPLGGSIFTSVGKNFINNQLLQRLSGLPDFDASLVENTGATTLSSSLPPELLHLVLVAYNNSLRQVFRVGLVLACLAVIGSASYEWRSVKKQASLSLKRLITSRRAIWGIKANTRQAVKPGPKQMGNRDAGFWGGSL